MKIELSAIEARVIGCLLEKEATTPDQYPLTLNSLMNACNQKSNREPVMSLNEEEMRQALDSLISRHLVSDESTFNSRVSKYQHRFCDTEFGDLQFTKQEKAIICCLLLRGPQTPGELRTRTNRLAEFTDVKETEAVLDTLSENEAEHALVVKLPRESGKRDSRYMHQFSGLVDITTWLPVAVHQHAKSDNQQKNRMDTFETELEALKNEVSDLKEMLKQLI